MPVGRHHGDHLAGLRVLCQPEGYCADWNDTGRMTQQMGGRCWVREDHDCVAGGPDDEVPSKGPGYEDLVGPDDVDLMGPGDEDLKDPGGEDPSYAGGRAGTVVYLEVHKLLGFLAASSSPLWIQEGPGRALG